MSYSRWSDEVIETAVEHRPACYTDMEAETYAASVKQMHDDLSRLAHEDGCIAAAWALESVRMLAEDLRGRKGSDEYMVKEYNRLQDRCEKVELLSMACVVLLLAFSFLKVANFIAGS